MSLRSVLFAALGLIVSMSLTTIWVMRDMSAAARNSVPGQQVPANSTVHESAPAATDATSTQVPTPSATSEPASEGTTAPETYPADGASSVNTSTPSAPQEGAAASSTTTDGAVGASNTAAPPPTSSVMPAPGP